MTKLTWKSPKILLNEFPHYKGVKTVKISPGPFSLQNR